MNSNGIFVRDVRVSKNAIHKPILLLLCWIFSLQSIEAQINTNKVSVDLSSLNFKACSDSTNGLSTVTVLSKQDTTTDFEIAFDLPTGVYYQAATATIIAQVGSGDFVITELDISDLNRPTFRLERPANAPWQINDQVEFTFAKTADCDAVQHSYNGGLFKDAHTITFNDHDGSQTESDDDLSVNSYNVLKAFLAVDEIAGATAHVGEFKTRNIIIRNSGNGSVQRFDHQVQVSSFLQSGYQLLFNGTALTPTAITGDLYTYEIDLNAAPFSGQVGDGDNLFENESITLVERLSLSQCAWNEATRHSPRWGCTAGNYCQLGAAIPGQFSVEQEYPDLSLTKINHPDYPRWDAPVTYTNRIENDAAAEIAYNVNINIGYAWNPNTYENYNTLWGDDRTNNRLLSNFRFVGGTTFIPARWPNADDPGSGIGSYLLDSDVLTSDPDGPGGLEDLDGDGYFDDLAPGNHTDVQFDLIMLPSNPSCDPYNSNYLLHEQLHMEVWSVNTCNNASSTQRYSINSSSVSVPSLFNWDTPEAYDRDAIDGQVFHLTFTGRIDTAYDVPTCNGIEMLGNDASTLYQAEIVVPNGVTLDGSADGRYSQSGNTITFTETNLAGHVYNNWSLRVPIDFPLNIDCATYGGPETLAIDYSTRYLSSCFDREIHCGTFELETHCPDGCSGPTTTSFEANRVTAGWTDNSMSTKVVLDPNVHATKYYMAKDKMVVTASAEMRNDVKDNLYFEMRYITESGLNMSDIIQFDSGTITIDDLSSGTQTTAITTAPVITISGTNDNLMTFDLSAYRSIISPTYEYGEGFESDEIQLELHFTFKEDFPEETRLYQFYDFTGNFYGFDGSGAKINCEAYGDRAFFFENKVSMIMDSNNQFVTGCDRVWLWVSLEQSSGLDDKFPNEFRPPVEWQSTIIEIPEGMQFDNTASSYGYPDLQPENENPGSWNNGLNYSVTGNLVTITPGPRFIPLDQDGNNYPNVQIALFATSATPTATTFDAEVNYSEYAYADNPVNVTETDTEDFRYYNKSYSISSPEPAVIGSSELASFTVNLSNGSVSEINYNWLRVDGGTGYEVTNAYLVDGASETPLNVVLEAGIYYIEYGAMEGHVDNTKTIRFEGTYDECSVQNIKVSQNYDCIGYPTSYAGLPYFHEQTYTLEPVGAAIQLNILSQPTTTVDTCTDYDVVLEARNAGEGDLTSPTIEFDIPGDISSIAITDIVVEYPRNSGIVQSITPSISGNTVQIDLLQHPGIDAQNGLPGSHVTATLDNQIAHIVLRLNPQCNYRSNSGTTYLVYGTNSCGTPAIGNGSRLASNPIILTGAEPPYSTSNAIGDSIDFEGCETETVEIETYIIDGVTGSDDFVRIVLPAGLDYVANSFASTGTATATYLNTHVVGDHQELEIQLPSGADAADLIAYNFGVESTAYICEGTYTIELNTYVTTTGLNCGGTSCGTTEIVTGEADTEIAVTKGELEQSSFTATAEYVQSASDTEYTIALGLQNTGDVDLTSGISFEVFCADGSGDKVGSAMYSGVLSQGITVGSSIQESFSFSSGTFCGANANVVVEFASGSSNCFCNALSIVIPSERIVNQCDPISSGNVDTDGDGLSDVCDMDDDNDGILDSEEIADSLRSYQAAENSGLASYYVYRFSGNSDAVDYYREPQLLSWLFDSAPADLTYSNITANFGGAQKNLSDIAALTFAEAKSNGEYFESTFTTGVNLVDPFLRQVHIEWETTDIGDDYSARLEVIVGGVVVYTSPEKRITPSSADSYNGTRGFYSVKPDLASHWLALDENTTYTVRTYVYNVDASSSAADFVILDDATYRFSAALARDTDGDTIFDHLDDDSDNDGCVDAIEAGHTDTDADGYLGNSPVSVDVNGLVTGQGGYTGATGNEIVATEVTLNNSVSDQTSNTGDSASFTVDVTAVNTTEFIAGNPDYSGTGSTDSSSRLRFQWRENGTDLSNGGNYSGVDTATLSILDVTGLHDNTYTVAVTHLDQACIATSESAVLTVIPDITIDDSSAAEGNDNVFTITASHSVAQDLVFNISYVDISTTNADYSGPATVTLLANSTSVAFNVAAIDDALVEPTESHETSISQLSGPAVRITDDTGIGTITDTDMNIDLDSDDDGLLDSFEDLNTDGDDDPATNPTNSDGDAYPDYLDIDSDNDGIPDNVEAQTTADYIAPLLEDANDNGLDDAYEADGELGLLPVNTDGEDLPDYLDNDSDNDNVSDAIEGNDQNHDGVADVVLIGSDKDHDGLDDGFEGSEQIDSDVNDEINSPIDDLPNTDGDSESDYRDIDDDGDGIPTADEDTNGDSNYANDDWDNDGVPDYLDPDLIPAIEDVEVFNVVTPNGDGAHDYLIITGLDIRPDNTLQIYNRWGILVYETAAYNSEGNTFDGSSGARATYEQDSRLPTGTYYYILNYEDVDGTSKTLSGHLYLN